MTWCWVSWPFTKTRFFLFLHFLWYNWSVKYKIKNRVSDVSIGVSWILTNLFVNCLHKKCNSHEKHILLDLLRLHTFTYSIRGRTNVNLDWSGTSREIFMKCKTQSFCFNELKEIENKSIINTNRCVSVGSMLLWDSPSPLNCHFVIFNSVSFAFYGDL